MKFGHLLKSFVEGDDPDKVCLNYKKLKKLIKAQKAHIDQGLESAAPAEAASGAQCGASSDDEDMPGAPPPRAAAAAAAVAVAAAGGEPGDASSGVAEEDREFIATLNEDLGNINAYFMEKEEDAVIRLRALEDRLAAFKPAPAGSAAAAAAAVATATPTPAGEGGGAGAADAPPAELEKLRSEMVDFHGELVLLLHWSLVNYAAVAKILKKHDKLTGSRLRAPVLASVLHQPFLSTESISQLVKAAERHVQELTQLCGGSSRPAGGGSTSEARSAGRTASAAAPTSSTSDAVEEAAVDPEADLAGSEHVAIFKRTRAALHMLNDMQQHASTPSTLLPPQAAASDAAPDKKRRMSSEQAQQLGAEAQLLQQQQQQQRQHQ